MDMPLALLNRRRRGSVLNPEILFSVAGSRGFFYDFSDYSTQFTDTAGTAPVTGVGQSLARINDASGLGNNATQATAGSRPLTQVRPMGVERRNLLTFTEQFDNAAWSLDNSGATNPVVTANFASAPDGTLTADRIQLNKTGGLYTRIQQVLSGLTSGIYTFSVWLKNNVGGTANVGIRIDATGVNCAVTSTWQRFSVTLAVAGTIASGQILLFDTIIGNDDTADILAWGAQVELGSTASTYQPTGPVLINGEKRNLLTFTEQFDNAVWVATQASVVPNVAISPNGALADRFIPSTSAAQHFINQSITNGPSGSVARVRVRLESSIDKVSLFPGGSGTIASFNLTALSTSNEVNVTSSSITPLGNGWFDLTAVWPSSFATDRLRFFASSGSIGSSATAGDGVSGILIARSQLELGSTATAYQRVITANEWYEEGYTSYRGIAFDGVDDFLQTAAIDFSNSDKMTVVAGVRKLSDAATGILLENSATIASNNGVVGVSAPLNTSGSTFGFASKGTAFTAWSVSGTSFAAPSTVVLTGLGDIAADTQILRLNGAQIQSQTNDQGTGNYGNYPVYIGRRGGTTFPFNGILTFLCVINRTLTAAELAQLEAFANSRTGAY